MMAGNLKANTGDKQTLFRLKLTPHRLAFDRNFRYGGLSYNY